MGLTAESVSRQWLVDLDLKLTTRHAGLANDGAQRTDAHFIMIRYGYGEGAFISRTLHRDVTAAPAHLPEAVLFENSAHLSAG